MAPFVVLTLFIAILIILPGQKGVCLETRPSLLAQKYHLKPKSSFCDNTRTLNNPTPPPPLSSPLLYLCFLLVILRRIKSGLQKFYFFLDMNDANFRTVKPRLTISSLLRPPFLAACQKAPYIFLQKKSSLIRLNFFGPLVTVLTGFHCIQSHREVRDNVKTVHFSTFFHIGSFEVT